MKYTAHDEQFHWICLRFSGTVEIVTPIVHTASEWVSLSEGAKISTLSKSTIWRRAKDDKIPKREVDNGVGKSIMLVRREDMVRFREIEELKKSLTGNVAA